VKFAPFLIGVALLSPSTAMAQSARDVLDRAVVDFVVPAKGAASDRH
jgi:hypothetical protein